jgi:hypothetical protein
MKTITIDKSMSIDISYSINTIDQCTINSLTDLYLRPFDEVKVLLNGNKIFNGYVIDSTLNSSFGQQNCEYTINSPLWILSQQQTESKTSFLQVFAKLLKYGFLKIR